MPTTPNAGLRYPDLTSAPNVPLDIGNLASDADTKVNITVATISARDALTKASGMRVYVTADKRIYSWDGTQFNYAGGAPPPIPSAQAITITGGWTAVSGYTPCVYKDSSGLINFEGTITNVSDYTPTDSQFATLPVGFRPARDLARLMLVNVAPNTLTVTIQASTGNMLINNGSWAGSGLITHGTVHTIGSMKGFHPGYTGTLPFS